MGTTSEKLTYLNGTKQKLKQAINNLGGEVTDETTFRNYVAELENAYDRLPKTEFEEGESVTLENTLKGKLDFQDGKVGFGQSSQETTQGYQMYCLPPSKTLNGITYTNNGDGTCDIVGTATAQCDFALATRIPLASSPITLGSACNISVEEAISGVTFQVVEYNSGGTWIATQGLLQNTQSQNITISDNSNIAYIDYNIRVYSGATVNAKGIKLMMNTGTTRKDFEPYTGGQASPNPSYPQTINSVTGNQDVVVSGKNLFEPVISVDGTQIVGNNISNLGVTDGEFSFTANGADAYFGQVLASGSTYMSNRGVKIYRNGNEKISYKISNTEINRNFITAYDSNGTSLGYVEKSGNAQGTYTFPTDCDFVTFRFGNGSAVSGKTYKFNVMVAYGDTIPTYEPYITPKTYQLSLGDHKFYGIGTYRDYILRTTGKNLFDDSIKEAYYYNSSGERTPETSSSLLYSNQEYKITDQKITISFRGKVEQQVGQALIRLCEYNGDTFIKRTLYSSQGTITLDPNTTRIITSVNNSDATHFVDLMIEIGSTASDYQPFGVGNWYKVGKIGEIVLDGSDDENWQMDYSTGFVSNRFTCDNLPSLDVTSQTNFDYGYCNIGKITSEAYYSTYLNAVKLRYINNQNRVDCMFDIESLNAFKTLLAQTPMEIYYQRLGKATYTPITGTLAEQLEAWYNAHSLNGTTIITSNGDLPLVIKVRGLKGE